MNNLRFSAKVYPLKSPSGSLQAFATLIVNEIVQVNGFRVIDGRNGLFAAPPSTRSNKQDENGKDIWYDDVRFNEDLEEGERRGVVATAAYEAILEVYKRETQNNSRQGSARSNSDRPNSTGGRPNSGRAKLPW